MKRIKFRYFSAYVVDIAFGLLLGPVLGAKMEPKTAENSVQKVFKKQTNFEDDFKASGLFGGIPRTGLGVLK